MPLSVLKARFGLANPHQVVFSSFMFGFLKSPDFKSNFIMPFFVLKPTFEFANPHQVVLSSFMFGFFDLVKIDRAILNAPLCPKTHI